MRIFYFLTFIIVQALVFNQKAISRNIPEIIEVRIFSGENIKRFSFTPATGRYLICNTQHEKLLEVKPLNTIVFEITTRGFDIYRNDSLLFSENEITLQGAAFHNSFFLKPLDKNLNMRAYDGDLRIRNGNAAFSLVNIVPFESYVAGTVQWESGFNRHNVFYQVQAIIIRTYALQNLNRHSEEGFHLCDRVHCQAYYGKTNDVNIINAVDISRGEVVTDVHGRLLNTVYHANCGGQTVNSEDLWTHALSYLRSDKDTFCRHMPGASWEARIPAQDFRQFLHRNYSIKPSDQEWKHITGFRQNSRKHHLDEEESIRLRHVREHFALRSTYFSIEEQNDTLLLSGKGYGHGVGLCQEGAMQRAMHGHSREKILQFYYKGAMIRFLEPEIIF